MFVFISIGILALLILVHEAGHFTAARLQGIHVNRFSIGFGPVLWRHQGAETEYALRALPLGGYVGFPDDDEACPYPPNDPDLLKNRPVLDRAVVMVAGVLANLIFAYLVLLVLCGAVGIPSPSQFGPGIVVPQVAIAGPAETAGLQAGDIVLAAGNADFRRLDGEEAADAAISELQALIQDQGMAPIEMLVQRGEDETPLTLTVIPQPNPETERLAIGVTLAPNRQMVFRRGSIGEVFGEAANAYQRIVMLNVRGLAQLVGNFQNTAGQLSGPVGIVNIGADLARTNPVNLFNFTALISINLAILNILPLPALDGGHLAFLLLEALRGKKLPNQVEERVMQTGLVLLLGLGMVLILKDTLGIVTGGR